MMELGSEDDLTVLGTDGTVPDPDVEVKGFSIFGSTNVVTHISTAAGNVVINGALQVSSNIFTVGYSSAAKFYGDGSALTGISTGDSLGTHVATKTLDMASFNIVGVSTLTVSSVTTLASGVTFSTNVYVGGRLGVGTSAPSAALTVGSGQFHSPNGTVAAPAISFTDIPGVGLYNQTGDANAMGFASGGALQFQVWPNGLGMKTGTAAVPAIHQINSSDTGMYWPSAGNLAFSALGVERLRITSGGAVGISTKVPQAALDIVSTGTASNVYAQIWRNSSGVEVASMTSQGVLYATMPPGTGDNLGNHTATQNLNLGAYNLVNVSSVNFRADVFLSSASAANYGGVYVSSNLYVNGKLYGDGSSLTGLGGTLSGGQAPRIAYWTGATSLGNAALSQDAAGMTVIGSSFTVQGAAGLSAPRQYFAANVEISSASAEQHGGVYVSTHLFIAGISSATRYYGDGSALTGIGGNDNLGNHTATAGLDMAGFPITNASTATFTGFVNVTSTVGYAMDGSTVLRSSVALAGTFVGVGAGQVNSGVNNAYFGYGAGRYNTTGSNNSFLGYRSGFANTSGQQNSFVGNQAGYSNTTGGDNSFLGFQTGRFNTTGSNNSFLGNQAGYYNQTGAGNAVVGYRTGGYGAAAVNSFSSTTIMGYLAGYNLTTGNDNVFLGWQAGYAATSGTGNIVIGYNEDTSDPAASNELNIGGVLFGKLDGNVVGISTRNPQATLDIVSTGTASNVYAQIWRNSSGVEVASMTSQGVLYATMPPGTGDNLGNHTATQGLNLAGNPLVGAGAVTASGPVTAYSSVTVSGLAGVKDLYASGISSFTNAAYFTGVSSFSNVANVHYAGGNAGQVLAKVAGGGMQWSDVSAMVSGDNMGTHVATKTLDMASFNIVGVSSVNFRSNVFVTSATAANYGGVYVSSNLFVNGKLYGDGSALTGISAGDSLGTHVATKTLDMASFNIIGVSTLTVSSVTTLASGVTFSTNVYVGGRLGIGTSAPSAALTLASGQFHAPNGTVSAPAVSFANIPGVGLYNQTGDSNAMGFAAGGALQFQVWPNGLGMKAGTAAVPAIHQITSSDTGIYWPSAGNLAFSALGVERLRITSGGAVGISTKVPQAALDIVSTGTASNVYAQIWRNSGGVEVASMTSQGVLYATLPPGAGDNLGNHTATQNLNLAQYSAVNVASVTMVGKGLQIGTDLTASASGITISTTGAITTIGAAHPGSVAPGARGVGAVDLQNYRTNASSVAAGPYSVIAGGYNNRTRDLYSVVAGGYNNTANGESNVVGGGSANVASGGWAATVAGGIENVADRPQSTVGGGYRNYARDYNATVAGGTYNYAILEGAAIGGGEGNYAEGYYAAIPGGMDNQILNADYAFAVGVNNQVTANEASAVGGSDNIAAGLAAVTLGGENNVASGNYSFAAGYMSSSTANGAFTWSDSEGGVQNYNSVANRTVFKNVGGFLVTGSTNPAMTGGADRGLLVTGNGLVGISTGVPGAALDVVSTGTASNVYAQIWRNSNGVEVASMTADGKLYATLPNVAGDNLGSHTATQNLNMAAKDINAVAHLAASSATFAQAVTASSFTAAGTGFLGAQMRFNTALPNLAISSEASAALGGGLRISSNVYVVGFASAAAVYAGKFYGDGSSLTGIAAGDSMGTHVATKTLNMASFNIVGVSSVNFRSNVFLTSATAGNYGGVYVSTHIYTPADLRAGNIYASGKFYGDGSALTGLAARNYLTLSLPTVANEYIEIGNFDMTSGAHNLYVAVTVSDPSFAVAKQYLIPVSYNMTSGLWRDAVPLINTGAASGNDFALEVRVSNTIAYLRLRRTSGAAAGTALVSIEQLGSTADVFTQTGGAGTSAANTLLPVTAITQLGGNVGIGTLSPGSKLEVAGDVTLSGSMRSLSFAGGQGVRDEGAQNISLFTSAATPAPILIKPGDAESARFTPDLKLGIGPDAPAYRLQVSSAAGFAGTIVAVSTGAIPVIRLTGDGSVYANRYFGDGSNLTNVGGTLSGGQTPKLAYWTGPSSIGNANLTQDAGGLTVLNSTFTVQGSAFSVGGSTLTVASGRVGIGVAAPDRTLAVQSPGGAIFKVDSVSGYVSLWVNGTEMVRMKP